MLLGAVIFKCMIVISIYIIKNNKLIYLIKQFLALVFWRKFYENFTNNSPKSIF